MTGTEDEVTKGEGTEDEGRMEEEGCWKMTGTVDEET
jgi:hypothetical protein